MFLAPTRQRNIHKHSHTYEHSWITLLWFLHMFPVIIDIYFIWTISKTHTHTHTQFTFHIIPPIDSNFLQQQIETHMVSLAGTHSSCGIDNEYFHFHVAGELALGYLGWKRLAEANRIEKEGTHE